MRSLGLDIGDRRIGVAISDALGILASPLKVLERNDDLGAVADIIDLVKKYEVGVIVSGLPRSLDGSLGPQAGKVQAFIEKLRQGTSVTIELRDERLSTVSAKRLLREGGKRGQPGRKVADDAAAAAIILQSYLDEARPIMLPPEDEAG